jgi:hydroxypyruvate isomerase
MAKILSETFRLAAKAWVEADAAASLLEETKSANLSQMMLATNADSVSKAEMLAKASEQWTSYIKTMTDARKHANLLKVQLEWIRMKFSEQQSAEATARAERRI